MVGKGGLSFLAKKSWHVSNAKNIDKVEKAEKLYNDEQDKIKQLQYERSKEYELEQLSKLKYGGQHISTHGIDWMYKRNNSNDQETKDDENESALLGHITHTHDSKKINHNQYKSRLDRVLDNSKSNTNNTDNNTTNNDIQDNINQLQYNRDDPMSNIIKQQHNMNNIMQQRKVEQDNDKQYKKLFKQYKSEQRKLEREMKKLKKQRIKYGVIQQQHEQNDDNDNNNNNNTNSNHDINNHSESNNNTSTRHNGHDR